MLSGQQVNNIGEISEFNITKKELHEKYPKLKTREVHVLDQNFRTSLIKATDDIILIKLDYVRALISKDEALIFAEKMISSNFFVKLKANVENKDGLAFEFKVLDELCNEIREYFDIKCDSIREDSSKILPNRADEYEQFKFNNKAIKLRFDLAELTGKVKDIFELFKSLEDDEDYHADFCLSSKELSSFAKDRTEFMSIVETYKSHFEENYDDMEQIENKFDVADKVVTMKLDITRNKLASFNVSIDIVTLSIAICALIAGIFGMNVPNYAEDNDNFIHILGYIFIAIIVIALIFVMILRKFIKI